MPSASHSPLVSVIVPVYNAERWLRRCIDSILQQSMGDLELIAVNDGSSDDSLQILLDYAAADARVTVLNQDNVGQGAARNRALDLAAGEYVLFVDADDFVERVTLQVTTERAELDHSDLVHFDWKFASADPARPRDFHYYNVEPYWGAWTLEGAECEELFRMNSYFSVTNLYRGSFLHHHKIRFEEGRLYEDNPFLAQVFTLAETISLVHSPLYTIQANPLSSTKTGGGSGRHMEDHLHAIRETFERITPRNPLTMGVLADYHLGKFLVYVQRRVPQPLRRGYAEQLLQLLSNHSPTGETGGPQSSDALLRICRGLGVVRHHRARVARSLGWAKQHVGPTAKRAARLARRGKRVLRHPIGTGQRAVLRSRTSFDADLIVFLGFDGRYTGNSRALFEELNGDSRFAMKQLRFVTTDSRVAAAQRIKPGSSAAQVLIENAGTVVAETWIPNVYRKHARSNWVQLWHGAPIKRLLFDSPEPHIVRRRPMHKVNKYADLLRWDLLLGPDDTSAERFATALLMPMERMLVEEYPRVRAIRQGLVFPESRAIQRGRQGIHDETLLVLYAPTWRDRNYDRPPAQRDTDFLLSLRELMPLLDPEAVVIVKDHEYLAAMDTRLPTRCLDGSQMDISHLLSVCDVVVTDYSSVADDATQLGIPVFVFARDLARYEAERGIYPGAFEAIGATLSVTTTDLAERLNSIRPQGQRSGSREGSGRSSQLSLLAAALLEFPALHGSGLAHADRPGLQGRLAQ